MARILIIEDEWIIAEDLKMILQSLGHEIVGIASSGKEALRIVEKTSPDLIFMDIQLEGDIDGIETAKIIREKDKTPIIYCTSNTDNASVDKMTKSKLNGLVKKPFTNYDIELAIFPFVAKADIPKRYKTRDLSFYEEETLNIAESLVKYAG